MICFYHEKDLDGHCSGAIVKKKYPDATLVGYDYGKPFPWESITGLEPVVMVDVSLPMEDMFKLHAKSNFQFTWIDHHASAIADFQDYCQKSIKYTDQFINAVLQDGIAACEIAWKHFFPEEQMPLTVRLLGMYDTWRRNDYLHWEEEIYPFQFGMRLDGYTADTFPQHLLTIDGNSDTHSIIETGEIIIKYQEQQNKMAMHASFVVDFGGLRALCVNSAGFNSEAFKSVWDEEKHDMMMPIRYTGKFWVCSMYTTKDNVDCSVLAKQMGGGGHKKAAGFQCPLIQFPDTGSRMPALTLWQEQSAKATFCYVIS